MLSSGNRLLLALLLILLTALPSPAAPAEKPTAKQIAQWITELGDNKFSVREKASKKLWAAGFAAESALEEALKSDDAEVARRARDILDKFKWGIYPDTPADIVALIRAYQSAEAGTRPQILQKLLQCGTPGLQAVLKIARNEKDLNQRKALALLVSSELPASLPQVLEHNDFEKFEVLLEIGHESETIQNNQYVAYWLLRGKLDERIKHFRALLARNPEDTRFAETLVYLHRARGDLTEARKAAEQGKRNALLDGILFEAADWKALAARKDFSGLSSAIERQAFAAAFARLAGKSKEFDSALDGIQAMIPKGGDPSQFIAAKALFLNDRPADALELLAKSPDHGPLRFEILATQLNYSEAFKILEEARPAASNEQKQLEVLKARTLYLLGEKDKAQALFAQLGEQIKDGVNPYWVNHLLETELKLGLTEQAFKHGGRALSATQPEGMHIQPGVQSVYLPKLFPKRTEMAVVWWDLLRTRFKDESAAKTLQRLSDLIEGKIAAREVKVWIEEAEKREPAGPNPRIQEQHLIRRQLALAEAAAAAGLDDLAASILEKADAPQTLLRLGDLLADKKQWDKAAERYRQAWRKSLTPRDTLPAGKSADPLPLYLAGDALVKAGQDKEGKKLMERSHWMLLGDAKARFLFIRALTERGHTEAVPREAELLLGVSEPGSYYSGAAARRLAIVAAARKDYLKAADGFEQSMLHCLQGYISYIQPGAYVAVPAHIHQVRARGLLAAGKLDEARKHIETARALLPGNVALPIQLVPELERGGHKKEAAALFEQTYAIYDKMCRDYPNCAWSHNSAAWLSACCRRNLDQALEHAQKAVELTPKHAGYLDTLAEVHFQRGDKEKAIALQKRVVEMDPKKPYFRKQLKRLEAGDPSAERPAENDD